MIVNTFKRFQQLHCLHKLSRTAAVTRLPAMIRLTTPSQMTFSSSVDGSDSHEDFQAKKKTTGIDADNITDEQALELIKEWVTGNKICLFMKGDPKEPRCGFSNFLVQTLKFYKIKDYKSIDVLKYEVIRKQVKVYSNWPTFPQLFIDGKLIGGSDIVSEMHKDGSLKELFLKAKIIE